mmetsp:Transcript_67794/g.109977  ORF Transcript_67794/g.109977 Transcript_67794/m.109977 type:complete len:202 (+) Transcript_67794:483-1088(+)
MPPHSTHGENGRTTARRTRPLRGSVRRHRSASKSKGRLQRSRTLRHATTSKCRLPSVERSAVRSHAMPRLRIARTHGSETSVANTSPKSGASSAVTWPSPAPTSSRRSGLAAGDSWLLTEEGGERSRRRAALSISRTCILYMESAAFASAFDTNQPATARAHEAGMECGGCECKKSNVLLLADSSTNTDASSGPRRSLQQL